MNNGGQVCISVERVYVEEPVYDEFVNKVTDSIRQLRQGVPEGIGTVDVGTVIFRRSWRSSTTTSATPLPRAPRWSLAAIRVPARGGSTSPRC